MGKLSFRSGMVMASADEIYITIRGKGGHAAAPHLTADTILVASTARCKSAGGCKQDEQSI